VTSRQEVTAATARLAADVGIHGRATAGSSELAELTSESVRHPEGDTPAGIVEW
jgi:hypothetical protein